MMAVAHIQASTMSPSTRRRSRGNLKPDRHRALELLAAGCPQEGCTEAVLLAHRLKLVRSGLATVTAKAERERMEVATLRIGGAAATR
jgi:hypothetical protein